MVFAHRGGAGIAPENTIAAFDAGLACGADGLELDVRLSADGIPVVLHDPTLDRTTSLKGDVGNYSAADLERADAAYRFSRDGGHPWRGRGIGVPTLLAVLRRYPDTPIIVEMKEDTAELAQATLEVIRSAGAMDRVCLGSFGTRVLRVARSLESTIATSASRMEVRWGLYRSRMRWPIGSAPYQAYQVPEVSKGGTRVVSRRFVTDAQRAGIVVQVWTVDHAAEAERLLGWGVDDVITDRPDVIVPLVRQVNASSST